MNFVSGTTELANLIPEIWSPITYQELRNKLIFADVFERTYEGSLQNMGDTVKVNQIVAPTGEILTDDKQEFASETMQVNQFNIVVNKRASASFEITDLAMLQSQAFEAEAQESLVYAIRKQIEEDLIAELAASATLTDNPTAASDLAAVDMARLRTTMSTNKVPTSRRFFIAAPSYIGDLITKQQIASRDYVPAGSPTTTGAISEPLYGFTMIEHDLLSADLGYALHPSCLQMVMQQGLRIKVSDLHSNNKYGFLISADIVYGFNTFDSNRYIQMSG
jgi:hypothetical protein